MDDINVKLFIDELSAVKLKDVFNPYSEICDTYDHDQSATIRCNNIRHYFSTAAKIGVDGIWLGRDPGYLGARRTGIAFTDEEHLYLSPLLYPQLRFEKATKNSKFCGETTSKAAWECIRKIRAISDHRIFLWNAFPFHPYHPDKPLSNRSFNPEEGKLSSHLLIFLISVLQPKYFVAVGNDAQNFLNHVIQIDGYNDNRNLQVYNIRHPSYGGSKVFKSDILKLYRENFSK